MSSAVPQLSQLCESCELQRLSVRLLHCTRFVLKRRVVKRILARVVIAVPMSRPDVSCRIRPGGADPVRVAVKTAQNAALENGAERERS